jgi:hypothetical protein
LFHEFSGEAVIRKITAIPLVTVHKEKLTLPLVQYTQVILIAKRGKSGEEGRNRTRFLYGSGRKHFLRFEHSLTVLGATTRLSPVKTELRK